MATRRAQASERMMKAARKLARHHGMRAETKALQMATHRNPAVKQLLELEAMADMLESATAHMTELEEAAQTPAETPEAEIPAEAVGPATVETVEIVQPAKTTKGKKADGDKT